MSTVLVADDDPRVRKALRAVLEHDHLHVIEARDGAECLRMVDSARPDLLLLDLDMPVMNGWAVLRELGHRPGMPVIVVTASLEEHEMVRGLRAGADDFVTKPFRNAELLARVDARLRRPYADDLPLNSDTNRATGFTPREREVIRMLAQGASNDDIAARLVLSTSTVKFHVTNIMRKLGVTNRTAAARAAARRGLVG